MLVDEMMKVMIWMNSADPDRMLIISNENVVIMDEVDEHDVPRTPKCPFC